MFCVLGGRGEQRPTISKRNMYWDISKCIKPYLKRLCVDAIVGFCCSFDFWGFFGWCWNVKHICSSGFFDFINFNFYVIIRSWHVNRKVGATSSYEGMSLRSIYGQIYWATKPIATLTLFTPLRFAEMMLLSSSVALPRQKPPPSPPLPLQPSRKKKKTLIT